MTQRTSHNSLIGITSWTLSCFCCHIGITFPINQRGGDFSIFENFQNVSSPDNFFTFFGNRELKFCLPRACAIIHDYACTEEVARSIVLPSYMVQWKICVEPLEVRNYDVTMNPLSFFTAQQLAEHFDEYLKAFINFCMLLFVKTLIINFVQFSFHSCTKQFCDLCLKSRC